MRRPDSRLSRRSTIAVALGLGILLTSACTPAPEPQPTATATASEPAPEPSSAPTGPALVPEGTAADNLPLFALVTQQVWGTPEQLQGRAYVDALVAAGFDKAAMQVTADMTTVGNPAETIQFSVQWGQECLVGQVGPATGEPFVTVVNALPSGGCLIGQTRAIDW